MASMLLHREDLLWQSPIHPLCKKRVRQFLRYVVAHWPLSRPVKLVFRKIARKHQHIASCEHVPGGYLLTIDARVNYFQALELLLHEYAHALAWEVDSTDHGAGWAGLYADMIRAFFDGTAYEDSETW